MVICLSSRGIGSHCHVFLRVIPCSGRVTQKSRTGTCQDPGTLTCIWRQYSESRLVGESVEKWDIQGLSGMRRIVGADFT